MIWNGARVLALLLYKMNSEIDVTDQKLKRWKCSKRTNRPWKTVKVQNIQWNFHPEWIWASVSTRFRWIDHCALFLSVTFCWIVFDIRSGMHFSTHIYRVHLSPRIFFFPNALYSLPNSAISFFILYKVDTRKIEWKKKTVSNNSARRISLNHDLFIGKTDDVHIWPVAIWYFNFVLGINCNALQWLNHIHAYTNLFRILSETGEKWQQHCTKCQRLNAECKNHWQFPHTAWRLVASSFKS